LRSDGTRLGEMRLEQPLRRERQSLANELPRRQGLRENPPRPAQRVNRILPPIGLVLSILNNMQEDAIAGRARRSRPRLPRMRFESSDIGSSIFALASDSCDQEPRTCRGRSRIQPSVARLRRPIHAAWQPPKVDIANSTLQCEHPVKLLDAHDFIRSVSGSSVRVGYGNFILTVVHSI
jgi:hypothetical protein